MNQSLKPAFKDLFWQAFVAMAFSALLALAQYRNWWVFGACVFFAGIFPRQRLLLLASLNIYFWIFTNKVISSNFTRDLDSIWGLPGALSRALIFFAVIFIVWALSQWMPKRIRIFFPMGFFLAFILVTVFQSYFPQPLAVWMHPFAFCVLEVFTQNFLYIILLLLQPRISFPDLLFIRPFWGGPLPVPGTLSDLKTVETKRPEFSSQVRGLQLIIINILFLVGADLVKQVFLTNYDLRQIFYLDVDSLYKLSVLYSFSPLDLLFGPPKLDLVLAPALRYGVFFIESISLLGLQVGFLKTMGYEVPENFLRPWVSENFLDFFKRCQSYYTRFIIEVFMMPFFSGFGLIRTFRWRSSLSVFSSVLFFGLFFQLCVLQSGVFLKNSLDADLLSALGSLLVYYILLALTLAISVYFYREKKGKSLNQGFRVRSLFYYLFLSILAYYFVLGTFARHPQLTPPPSQYLYPLKQGRSSR